MWEFWRGKFATSRTGSGSVLDPGSPRALERRNTAVVNFKDLNLSVDDELSEEFHTDGAYHEDEDPTNKTAIIRTRSIRSGAQKSKLIIVMVGLPGRGKTFLCNKLKCYLNWLGHNTAHFNVGSYRRLQKEANEVQDASFFDSQNKHGVEARSKALIAALDDVMRFLFNEGGQVAIFDATNTTKERRQQLINCFHGRCQYIFIESICNDNQVLEDNYRYKMKYSPDYQGVDTEVALADFKERINKYNEVYEPIDDRRLHYIKLIDMVTGRGYMDVNRISGYIPGKIVFFLMQVCKAGMTAGQSRKIFLTRHGESQFNMAGRIGGDSLLTSRGEEYAKLLPEVLESRLPATFNEAGVPVSVWTSTLRRTIATANYLPYPKLRWKALDEIHAGVCDGMTYPEIAQKYPEDYEVRKRDKLRYRYPSGESYLDVIQRLEPVIIEIEREREFVVVVGHQAILRAIFGYFMAVPLDKVPRLDIPLHTLIELQPRADGTMEVSFLPVPVSPPKQISHQHKTHHTRKSSDHHQQQQQQQQAPLGSSPPLNPTHPGTTALLPSFGSLPASYFYGTNTNNTNNTSRDVSGSGWNSLAAAAAGAGGYHRRTASGSAVQLPRFPQNTSFATISSMASMHSGSSGNSSQSSLGSYSGNNSNSNNSSNNLCNVSNNDTGLRSNRRRSLGSSGGLGSCLGLGSNSNSNSSSNLNPNSQGLNSNPSNQGAQSSAVRSPFAASNDAFDTDRLEQAVGHQNVQSLQQQQHDGSSSSSSRPAAAADASTQSPDGSSSSMAAGSSPPPPSAAGAAVDASTAADLHLQGFGGLGGFDSLDHSVSLTSGADPAALAAAAVDAGGSDRMRGQVLGRGGLRPSGGSGASSTGSGEVQRSLDLVAAITSMNSLD